MTEFTLIIKVEYSKSRFQVLNAKEFRVWRLSNLLTLKEMADKLGITFRTLQHLETSNGRIRMENVKKIKESNLVDVKIVMEENNDRII